MRLTDIGFHCPHSGIHIDILCALMYIASLSSLNMSLILK